MQTNISDKYRHLPFAAEADAILRSCVHCGFCTATCPTYQLLGDELDSPRGRIYLIKQLLEGHTVSRKTQIHLDRCLTCRACETTCPSGVHYGSLVDIGRAVVEGEVRRPLGEQWQRALLRWLIPHPQRLAPLLRLGQLFKPLLPTAVARKIPQRQATTARPHTPQPRKMLILEGCAQSIATPNTNAATARVLDRLGIQLMAASGAGCCGAVSHHLAADAEGLAFMRRNIDAWWPHVEAGAEAIVVTASGCGVMIKDYHHLLKDDPRYAAKAARISALAKDISEVLREEDLSSLQVNANNRRIAFHSPCTLQHGQQLDGVVEDILRRLGFTLTEVKDPHLCCGSAGTYSLLQPALAQQLRDNKLARLQADEPELIVSANVGCQLHLATAATRPVKHWLELLAQSLPPVVD
jgi:glycolate oxidase iron-sulfur subunit